MPKIGQATFTFDHLPTLSVAGKAKTFGALQAKDGQRYQNATYLGNNTYARLEKRPGDKYDVTLFRSDGKSLKNNVKLNGGAISRLQSKKGEILYRQGAQEHGTVKLRGQSLFSKFAQRPHVEAKPVKNFKELSDMANALQGGETEKNFKFPPALESYGKATLKLAPLMHTPAKLAANAKWSEKMAKGFEPHAKQLDEAFRAGAGNRPSFVEGAPVAMIQQLNALAAQLPTRVELILKEMNANATKLAEATDPNEKDKCLRALHRNAEEMENFITTTTSKLEICGKVMTDPEVLKTLPRETRDSTLKLGESLKEFHKAFQEPSGEVQNNLAMAKRMLSSPQEAALVAGELRAQNQS